MQKNKKPYIAKYNLVGGKIEKENDGLNEAYRELEKINKLKWVSINYNFFDMTKYAGEGNIGHIIEEIKISNK